jgi:hypothetical protein
MGDRTTWFKRKKTRIDVGGAFKAIQKPLDLTKKSNSTSPDSQHLSSLEGSSSRRGASQTSYEAMHKPQEAEVACLDIDEVKSFICDIYCGPMIDILHQCNTPAEALIRYIFEVG